MVMMDGGTSLINQLDERDISIVGQRYKLYEVLCLSEVKWTPSIITDGKDHKDETMTYRT